MSTLVQDLRYGLRMLRKNPGFTVVAILTLALGIGANTAIFSLINTVMLKMLPVKNPEQLVLLSWVSQQTPAGEEWLHGDLRLDTSGRVTSHSFSYLAFEEFHRTNRVFFSLFGFNSFASANISAAGRATYAEDELVSGDYFSALGVKPILGRFITPGDESTEAPSVAVISYGLWSRQFGRSPAALGKSLTINGVPSTIVGVAPPQFFGVTPGRAVDVWVPLVQNPKLLPWGTFHFPGLNPSFDSPTHWWVEIIGRLKPGLTAEQARPQLELLFQRSRDGFNAGAKPQRIPHLQLISAAKGLSLLRDEFSTFLRILTVVVGVVLLIACANVAALLLARSAARQQEIALRLSLGGSRARVARQLLTESVLLAGLGGLAGMLFAHWATRALVLLISRDNQSLNLTVQLDAKVLVFTAAVSILTGILFGLAPAFRSTRLDLSPALKPGGSGASPRGKGTRVGLAKSLVVIQVALALLLSIGAGLFLRTLRELEGQSLGFNQDHLLLFRISPQLNGYEGERLRDFYARLRARLQALPGVKSASMSFLKPVSGGANNPPVSVESYESGPWKSLNPDWDNVGPKFFETMGIPVMLGRGIESRDTAGSPKVAVVNEAFAREAFGGRNPIGHRVRFAFLKESNQEYTIVGMVRNARLASVRRAPFPAVYTPYSQMPNILADLNFELRIEGDPLALVPTMRRAMRDIDPDMPISDVRTQAHQVSETLMQERLLGRLSSFFGGLAVLLACIGLYGLMAYAVTQRTNEIGIRMALGSQRSDALRLVVGQGLKLTLIGVLIGVTSGLALTRLLANLLYGVKATDPPTFLAVSLIVVVVAFVACYIPARRATKVDPLVALRYE